MSRLIAWLRRFGRDRRGVAALEFAFVAPVMIIMYFGMAEFCEATMANRKTAHTASALGDLVAQSDQLSNSDVTDLFTVGRTIMAPFSTTGLKMRISSVTVNASNVPKVDWSDGSGLTAYTTGATLALPTNAADSSKPFVGAGESVIVAEAQYTFISPVNFFLPSGLPFAEKYYLKPRKSNMVSRVP